MARKESPETKLVKAFITYIKRQGHWCWRNNSGATKAGGRFMRFGAVGSGDIMVVVKPNGRLLSIEAKAGKNKATDNQKEWMEKVKASGGVAGVARSFADVDELLAEAALECPSLF